MNHPPEIIAALIHVESEILNVRTLRLRLADEYAIKYGVLQHDYSRRYNEEISEARGRVASLLAQLESPTTDTVTISRDAANTCLLELNGIKKSMLSSRYTYGASVYAAIAELERALGVNAHAPQGNVQG